ncbi:MAG: hypothetical protein WD577_03170 [Bacteroidales bacterium]
MESPRQNELAGSNSYEFCNSITIQSPKQKELANSSFFDYGSSVTPYGESSAYGAGLLAELPR